MLKKKNEKERNRERNKKLSNTKHKHTKLNEAIARERDINKVASSREEVGKKGS